MVGASLWTDTVAFEAGARGAGAGELAADAEPLLAEVFGVDSGGVAAGPALAEAEFTLAPETGAAFAAEATFLPFMMAGSGNGGWGVPRFRPVRMGPPVAWPAAGAWGSGAGATRAAPVAEVFRVSAGDLLAGMAARCAGAAGCGAGCASASWGSCETGVTVAGWR